MARRRSAVGGEAEDKVARQAHGLGGRQVVRNDNGGDLQLGGRIFREAGEGLEEAAFDVVNVAHALAEIGVVHLRELPARVIGRAAHGGFGVDAVLADVLFGFVYEDDVVKHHQVALEDTHVLAARVLLHCRNQLLKIALRLHKSALQAQKLVRLAPGFDDILGDGDFAVPSVDECGTDGKATRRRQARNRPHRPLIAHPECRTCAPPGPPVRPGLPSPGLLWPRR